jgi:hypothetical protein
MTPEERSAKRSAQGRANAQAQFDRTGYYIPEWACKVGGYITIHNRFHVNTEKAFSNCPVCNGTLDQLRSEE